MAVALVMTHGPLRTVWCHGCNTSSLYEADIFVLSPDGISRVGKFSRCPRCKPIEPDPPRGTDHA